MSRTIIITGASDGIGAAAARELHRRGHTVVLVGRSPEKTATVARELGVVHFNANFAALDEVRRLAADLDQVCPQIDVLANNAGGLFGEKTITVDGFELTFQVNHLAPFLLTKLLMPKLIASRASIIQTSSSAARMNGKLDMSDLEHDRDYSAALAYGTSKLENILFTRELDRRYGRQGISSAAFQPGMVATNFAHEARGIARFIYSTGWIRAMASTPEKAAGQLVWLAEGTPGKDWQSGLNYENYKPVKRNSAQASDNDLAVALWERSETLLAGRS